jgi:hypothetical protein
LHAACSTRVVDMSSTTSRPMKQRWGLQLCTQLVSAVTSSPSCHTTQSPRHRQARGVYVRSAGIQSPTSGLPPFAGIPEKGRDITWIDAIIQLAHRAMLINVHRLIGGPASTPYDLTSAQTLIAPLIPKQGIVTGSTNNPSWQGEGGLGTRGRTSFAARRTSSAADASCVACVCITVRPDSRVSTSEVLAM